MAKCEVCGKSVVFGIKVSHSHRRSNRKWKPNVQRVRAIENGVHKKIYACTRCLRSGKVERGYGAGVNPNAVIAAAAEALTGNEVILEANAMPEIAAAPEVVAEVDTQEAPETAEE